MGRLLFLVLGAFIGAGTMLAVMESRADWLAGIDFTLSTPQVPIAVLTAIHEAEARSYAEEALPRRLVEEVQDILVFASPGLAYDLNYSVGRYRIRASTIETILPWARERGYLTAEDVALDDLAEAMAYFAEQPVLNDWQAAVYLEWLRDDHPELSGMTWEDIAADPALVAKLYSGYMGAGGDWSGWQSDLSPGPVAAARMGL